MILENDQKRYLHKIIDCEYFEWMYKLVIGNDYDTRSYKKLTNLLHEIPFVPRIERDKNRLSDGIDLRYHFGVREGYSNKYIEEHLSIMHCSVFEMIVALAFRIEETIMDDVECGNRTGQWFWVMITSLGLGQMSDDNFDEAYVRDVIYRFIDRDYEPNGKGGLFTLSYPQRDLREVEIWCQAMWYLGENFDFSL